MSAKASASVLACCAVLAAVVGHRAWSCSDAVALPGGAPGRVVIAGRDFSVGLSVPDRVPFELRSTQSLCAVNAVIVVANEHFSPRTLSTRGQPLAVVTCWEIRRGSAAAATDADDEASTPARSAQDRLLATIVLESERLELDAIATVNRLLSIPVQGLEPGCRCAIELKVPWLAGSPSARVEFCITPR